MTQHPTMTSRYWGLTPRPATKAEFFNAVTTPAPAGETTVATIRLYGPIDSWGGFWGISTKDVGAVLDALPDNVDQIVLRINSPGGEVFEGIAILNMLRAHKASVMAVVDGRAASAASVIASGCDEVVMSPGTQMMIHSPSVISWGNADQLRKDAEVLDTIESSLIEIYTAKAGDKDWAQLLSDETWLTATGAVEFGLADRVAVIPDAGESETVGDDPEAVVIVPPEGDEAEDFAAHTPLREMAFAARAQNPTHTPPSSSEPVESNRKENLVSYENLTAGLRTRLGVTDADVSDETLLAALDEALEEQTVDTPIVPEGTTLIDSVALETLQANAAQGVAALAEQSRVRRESIVDQAMSEGRIAPAARATWLASLVKDEEVTTALIGSLAKNTIPVSELGHQPAEASGDDAELYALFPDMRPTTKEA